METKEKLRPTLKDLRDALNKIPEDTLEIASIAWDCAITEEPKDEFSLLWLANDEDGYDTPHWKKTSKDLDDKVLNRFVEALNKDLRQARIREDEGNYDEEYNLDMDW